MARVRCYLSGVSGLICPVSAYDFDKYIDDIIEYSHGNDDYKLVVKDELVSFVLSQEYYINDSKIGFVVYRLDEKELSDYKKMGFIPELFTCFDANTHGLINMGVL